MDTPAAMSPTDQATDHRSGPPVDPDLGLVGNLFTLHPPRNADVGRVMDSLRASFQVLAELVVDTVPRTPERTIALRALHRACQDTITAVACHQDQLL